MDFFYLYLLRKVNWLYVLFCSNTLLHRSHSQLGGAQYNHSLWGLPLKQAWVWSNAPYWFGRGHPHFFSFLMTTKTYFPQSALWSYMLFAAKVCQLQHSALFVVLSLRCTGLWWAGLILKKVMTRFPLHQSGFRNNSNENVMADVELFPFVLPIKSDQTTHCPHSPDKQICFWALKLLNCDMCTFCQEYLMLQKNAETLHWFSITLL